MKLRVKSVDGENVYWSVDGDWDGKEYAQTFFGYQEVYDALYTCGIDEPVKIVRVKEKQPVWVVKNAAGAYLNAFLIGVDSEDDYIDWASDRCDAVEFGDSHRASWAAALVGGTVHAG